MRNSRNSGGMISRQLGEIEGDRFEKDPPTRQKICAGPKMCADMAKLGCRRHAKKSAPTCQKTRADMPKNMRRHAKSTRRHAKNKRRHAKSTRRHA